MFNNMFGLNPRKAFVGACISMIGVDLKLDEKELEKLFEVLKRYGIAKQEFNEEMDFFAKNSTNVRALLRHGQLIMEALPKLEPTMQKQLIQALTELAQSDGEFHEAEKMYLDFVKQVLGITA
jgi:uncharacterized tellurite resistance protein B-like protein